MSGENLREEIPRLRETYHTDGAICIRNVLDEQMLAEAFECFQWSLENPTPSACTFYDSETAEFYQDLCHPNGALAYQNLLCNAPLAELIATLWDAEDVWFLYEQVFVKQGEATRRTPWHQDTSYLALEGEQVAVAWISFDSVTAEHSLEFVRGSHRGELYNGSAFDAEDDTAPIYPDGLPRLPDIEANRAAWDILSFDVTPGDVVIFHPSTLHGGAATEAGAQRRTLSLRFFGADAVYAERPSQAPAPLITGLHETMRPGQAFRHPAFPRLRPEPQGFDEIPAQESPDYTLKNKIRAS